MREAQGASQPGWGGAVKPTCTRSQPARPQTEPGNQISQSTLHLLSSASGTRVQRHNGMLQGGGCFPSLSDAAQGAREGASLGVFTKLRNRSWCSDMLTVPQLFLKSETEQWELRLLPILCRLSPDHCPSGSCPPASCECMCPAPCVWLVPSPDPELIV